MTDHALASSQEVLRAIAMLNNTPEFRVFVNGLRTQREHIRDAMEWADSNTLVHALRGRSGELSEILDIIKQAQDLLAGRMRNGDR